MKTRHDAQSHPMMEYVSSNDLTVRTLITEDLNKCNLCGSESKSLYIYNFNTLLCDPCFKFAVSAGNN